MKHLLLVLFLALVGTAVSQTAQDLFIIDDFSVSSTTLVVVFPTNPVQSNFQDDVGILGGERDMELDVTSGVDNQVFATGVSGGDFTASSPNGDGSAATSTLQYDGEDNSFSLNPSGLGGIDLTSTGADQFHIIGFSDFATTLTIKVYSGSSNDFCQAVLNIPSGSVPTDFFVAFNSFSNSGAGCSFTNCGALELILQQSTNVDVSISQFTLFGVPLVSPTPTPTRTPTISQSRSITRTPTPTISITPTPSPIVENDECLCMCPAFRCELFRSDDEDGGIYAFFTLSNPQYVYWYGFPFWLLTYFDWWFDWWFDWFGWWWWWWWTPIA